MKFLIARTPDNQRIAVIKDFVDIDSQSEITQMLMELEIAKVELMELYIKYNPKQRD